MGQHSYLNREGSLAGNLFRLLFEQSVDGILITDQEGRLIDCNEAAYLPLGYTREEFVRLDPASLMVRDDSDECDKAKNIGIADVFGEFDCRQRVKDGSLRDIHVTVRPLKLPGQSLVATTWHDTSDCSQVRAELKESIRNLEQEKAKGEAVIQAIGEGLSIRDRDFRIIYQNRINIAAVGDHWGELCYRAYYGREEACDNCPVVMTFADGKIHRQERQASTTSGLRYFEATASPVRDSSGRIVAAIELVRDITEAKEAEQALRESNARMEALLNAIPDMVVFKDANHRWLVVNKAVEEISQRSRDEMLGKVDEDLSSPEVAAMCRISDEKAMKGDGPMHSEESMTGSDGETIYLDTIKAPMCDEQGNLAGIVVVSRDITERKKMEEALRLSANRMFKAQRMAHVGNWERRLDKDELYWSDEVYRIYGQEPGYFTPTFTAVQEAMHPDDRVVMMQVMAEALNRGTPYQMDYRLHRPDGTERIAHSIGEVITDSEGRVVGMAGTIQDVTDQKRLEAKVREQYAILRSIIESTDNPILSVDRGYRYTSFNQAHAAVMRELYGAEIELGKNLLLYIPDGKDRAQAKLGLDAALHGVKLVNEAYFGKGPQSRLYEASHNPIRDSEDQVVGVALYAADTTERRRAEELIRDSEKRLRDITSNMGVGLYVLDDRGRITFLNPMAERLWGWSLEELQEKGVHNLVHRHGPDGTPLPSEKCEILKVVNTGQPYSSTEDYFARKDGTVFPISIIATPLQEDGEIVASITAFRDISAEKELEEELLKVRKLESVGLLAGGIAHDFNNLLQAILGSISLVNLSLQEYDLAAIPPLLKQAELATDAAKELSFRLLTFAKGGDPIKRPESLEAIVRKSAGHSLGGSGISCTIKFPPDLPQIEVDGGQMLQVFNNMFINAREAMPDGGVVVIRTTIVVIGNDSSLPLQEGSYVRITVRDSGHGIPAESLSKIFDPYFSLKRMGSSKGAGLGLSICMAIVRKHDGHISVESRPGYGTAFSIYLPLAKHSSVQKREKGGAVAMTRKRLLFMDDDERVRRLVGDMIASQGYEVEGVGNGEEAVARYREAQESGTPFAAVILDLTVKGGMGGDTAVTRLRQIDPQVKAVIASGYADDPIMKNFKEFGFVGALSKPFTMQQLKDLLAFLMSSGEA